MADLLLELFSEEIPARMQADAREILEDRINRKFTDLALPFDEWKSFVTPRRLAIWVKELPVEQKSFTQEIKGPKVGAPEAALQGFLKKSGLQQSDLIERDGVYFALVKKAGSQTADILKPAIEEILASFTWPKSMRWGSGETAWVRPLHSILCIFDGNVIPIGFAGVTASNTTRGHRFLSSGEITITDPNQYEAALEKAFVIADRDKRKETILQQAQKLSDAKGLVLKKDDGLLEEVTGLVEYPVVLAGTIDAKFMDLPKEVLISEMRAHQKYFALENKDGSLSDTFLITANIKTDDGGKAIIAGNERVLRARLSDGRFFWDQDQKKSLADWAEGLKSVTYHAKLGSIADKVTRIKAIAAEITGTIGADKALVERAAALCKADLVTGMVGEFPELQGVMGRYYAKQEHASVADAIRDHYKPQGPSDAVPSDPVSVCVALADKLDTLMMMFAIGEKPTGSKDPFALRRAALGVIRIILENKVRLPLTRIFALAPMKGIALQKAQEKLAKKVEADLKEVHRIGKYVTVNETTCSDIPEGALDGLVASLLEFFGDRLKVQLKDQGIRHDVIEAVLAGGDDDLVRIVEKAKAVQAFLATDDGMNLLAAYKRASNILAIELKKTPEMEIRRPDGGELSLPEELALHRAMWQIDNAMQPLLHQEKFTEIMSAFSTLRAPVDVFFEKVLVNDKDAKVREIRLNLLSQLKQTLDGIANFAAIEGDSKEQKKAA